MDANGFMKCYALTQYKGLYRDAAENLRDLRPLEGKPCFSELIKKSDKELQQMLSAALTKQIEVLSASQEKPDFHHSIGNGNAGTEDRASHARTSSRLPMRRSAYHTAKSSLSQPTAARPIFTGFGNKPRLMSL